MAVDKKIQRHIELEQIIEDYGLTSRGISEICNVSKSTVAGWRSWAPASNDIPEIHLKSIKAHASTIQKKAFP